MTRRLYLRAAGPGVTVQDAGRHRLLRFGVTPAGPMDWTAFEVANRAVGNAPDAAALEISVGGLDVECGEAPLIVAFCGGAFAWSQNGKTLPSAACVPLQPGDRLAARAGAGGAWTYLAVSGGIDTPPVMGSRATHTRSQIGGLDGRVLRAGDVLPVGAVGVRQESVSSARIVAPWLANGAGGLRVILGPQDDYFSPENLAAFFATDWLVTPAADRMAYRLDGAKIEHARGFNIVSDGIALGAIQVAGDGRPLVLMADRQPTGGYPKLGHVIRADIGRLAQKRPGEACRFAPVSLAEARAALFALEDKIASLSWRQPLQAELTSERLLAVNLIDGVHNAFEE